MRSLSLIARPFAIVVLTLWLASCGPDGNPSVEGGGCKIIEQPDVPICGMTERDQRWLDINLARYGAACHWERRQGEPCKRPALPPETKPAPKKNFIGWLRHKKK